MEKIGLSEMMWKGMSYWDRKHFNNAASAIDSINNKEAIKSYETKLQLKALYELDEAQEAEIARLRSIVEVMCKMLIDSGAVDETVFGHRLEAAIEEANYEKNEAIKAAQDAKALDEAAEVKSREAAAEGVSGLSTCAKCSKEVPSRDIEFTVDGAVCASCRMP